mmetsp:Transcript_136571/g.323483  ORF Transcript_136571/g.323483 Transcript_136571/m.323483 type:complete len:202 (-) Transcript_136571:1405-2010(-)
MPLFGRTGSKRETPGAETRPRNRKSACSEQIPDCVEKTTNWCVDQLVCRFGQSDQVVDIGGDLTFRNRCLVGINNVLSSAAFQKHSGLQNDGNLSENQVQLRMDRHGDPSNPEHCADLLPRIEAGLVRLSRACWLRIWSVSFVRIRSCWSGLGASCYLRLRSGSTCGLWRGSFLRTGCFSWRRLGRAFSLRFRSGRFKRRH